ncbi:MAG: ABC transporter permease [Gemmatimonadetes bacterium]|nr:ABC transporter permease [Gemmatimonadota bacterium]MDA1103180.1 ABC transporter permease [Gemmatimonadota bacterium]
MRAALGAGRTRLVFEILGESLVLTLIAAVVALGLAELSTRLLVSMAPPEVPRLDEVGLDIRVLAFAGLVTVATTALFSLLPALRVTALDVAKTVKSGGGQDGGRGAHRLRDGLVVAELTLCVVLLAFATLLTRNFVGYLEWDPGFDRSRLVTVSAFVPPEKYATRAELVPLMRAAEAKLLTIPGVVAVSSASAGPMFGGGDGATQFAPEGWPGTDELPSAEWFDIGPGYFQALGVEIRQGREFVESDEMGSAAVVVVNEALAGLAGPEGDAVGRSLRIPARELSLEIVGVVADVPSIVPGQPPALEMYWPNRQMGRWGTHFVLRTQSDPGSVAASVAPALLTVDPDLAAGTPRTLASLEERALVGPRFQATVLLTFALAALLLAAGGVYAVVSYAVTRRAREMGIRVALGAASLDVIALIVRSSLGPVLVGVGLGLVLALSTGALLEEVLHGVSSADPLSLGGAALLLLLVAAVAALLPAFRATRVDPLVAIKAD